MLRLSLCGSAALLLASPAYAAEVPDAKPVLEIGIVGGGAYVPDYPAAGHSQVTGLALPYLIYRGKIFKSDHDGVRGELTLSSRWEFDLGVDASFSAKSDDNRQRRGLPDLDYVVELGPAVSYRIASSENRSLHAVAQFRWAYATDFHHIRDVGYAAEPQLVYEQEQLFGTRAEFHSSLSVKFADQRFNHYYYGVEPRYATAERPAFSARAGYQQTAWSNSVYWPLSQRLSVFSSLELLSHGGSANQHSPLFVHDFNYAIGAGLAYSLYLSDQLTTRD